MNVSRLLMSSTNNNNNKSLQITTTGGNGIWLTPINNWWKRSIVSHIWATAKGARWMRACENKEIASLPTAATASNATTMATCHLVIYLLSAFVVNEAQGSVVFVLIHLEHSLIVKRISSLRQKWPLHVDGCLSGPEMGSHGVDRTVNTFNTASKTRQVLSRRPHVKQIWYELHGSRSIDIIWTSPFISQQFTTRPIDKKNRIQR